MKNAHGKAAGGFARAAVLTAETRKAIALKGVEAKRELANLPCVTHGSSDHPLVIGDIEIPCYVLEGGTRVLSQRGLQTGIGMSPSGGSKIGEQRLVSFFVSLADKIGHTNDLTARITSIVDRLRNPIKFRLPSGGGAVYGYEGTLLADICDAILAARKGDYLQRQQEHIASQAELLVRGFARVGIIALIDEATGYQQDRAANALAQILEAFVAKELQPWVKTFPADFYEQLFRLRGLDYKSGSVQRPQYFGVLTNDIVYKRLAPGVLAELKKVTLRTHAGRPKHKYFQKLTANIGYPKLREHLGSVTTLMKLSSDYQDFIEKLNTIHPPYGATIPLPLGNYSAEEDPGTGI